MPQTGAPVRIVDVNGDPVDLEGGGGGSATSTVEEQEAQTALLTTMDADTGSIDTKLTTVIGHLDGVETTLTAIDGRVDGLEALVGATNTALDTVNTNLGTIDGRVDTLETLIASTNTKLDTLNAKPGTVLFAEIDRATSGAVVAAAGSGNKIRVLSYVLVATTAVTVEWRSASTGISGAMPLAANGGVSSGYSPVGHFETAANEALNLQLGSGVQVSGHVAYVIAT